MSEQVLYIDNIDKRFGGIHALDKVGFNLKRGEVHALLGENGAGKSTLIKILVGIFRADSGEIFIDGEKKEIKTPNDALALGISAIHQELALAKNMTVAENIFMGREFTTRFLKIVNNKRMKKEAKAILDKIGIYIDPSKKVSELGIAQQQVVEIAKALSTNARIILMDEPTAMLSKNEVERLFITINNLKSQKVSIIYISHRMDEIFGIADRVTVLRDGKSIGTYEIGEIGKNQLIKMMVGREIQEFCSHYSSPEQEVVLEIKNLTTPDKLRNVNIILKKGEILGIAGLVGSGRTELARAIFGVDKKSSGELILEGKHINIDSPSDAIKNGIALVPENRKESGLIIFKDLGFNITLCVLEKFIKLLRVNRKKEREIIEEYSKKLSIKAYSSKQIVSGLSGGNQQKTVLAKWLTTKPKILILDEPTRGIDVGAKSEIYNIMNTLVKSGVSIIMISSELPEIINMSDRVYVMYNGKITGEIEKNEIEQERIINYAIGEIGND